MRCICLITIAFFFFYEVLQFHWGCKSLKDYLATFWNLNDILMIIVYCIYMSLAYIYNFDDEYDVRAATQTM